MGLRPGNIDAGLSDKKRRDFGGAQRPGTEPLRLQRQFGRPTARVRLTLRTKRFGSATRQVLAQREFDRTVLSPIGDADGGVLAPVRAWRVMLDGLAARCAQAGQGPDPWRAWAPRAALSTGPGGQHRSERTVQRTHATTQPSALRGRCGTAGPGRRRGAG